MTQEAHSNGHVDLPIEAEHYNPAQTKLGEAKIYSSPCFIPLLRIDTRTPADENYYEVPFHFTGKLEPPKILVPTRRIDMKTQRIARTMKACPKMSVRLAILTAIILALPLRAYTHPEDDAPGAAANQSSQTPGTAAKPGPVMEQTAIDQLKRMSKTLSEAKSFTCKTRSTAEVPASNTGQYLTLIGSSEVAVHRPNKMRVRITGEVPNFDFYYDGTNVVAYAPQNKVYSITKAPGTLDEMLKFVEEKTGIQFPAADLLTSDPYAGLTKGLTSAFVVGQSTIDGVQCEHLAFMNPGIHWQVWVEEGKNALPQRLAVTYADVQNFPRRLIEFSDWNLRPRLRDSDFVFKAPSDAKQIEFVAPNVPAPTGRQKGQ